LYSFLKEKRPTENDLRFILAEVVLALEHLHKVSTLSLCNTIQ
jgi:hypothetical protein